MKAFFTLSFALIATSCLAQITTDHYRIYASSQGKEVTLDALVEAAKEYDVVIFGEEHNDSVAHFLQAQLLEKMHKRYNNVTLSMEMFERDAQNVMNEYLAGFVREKTFIKDARAWSNYKDYRPMVEYAKANALPVICANAPSRYTNLAGRKGIDELKKLPVESKKHFAPLPYDTAVGKYHEKLWAMSGHAPTATSTDTSKKATPVMTMGNFNLIVAQSLWDATMAYSISEHLKKNRGRKVFHLNGRFHSDERFAVVEQLKKYAPKAKVMVISSGSEDAFANVDWQKLKHLGDFIIITDPAVPRTFESK